MIELTGDLWSYRTGHNWLAITTNGDINSSGLAVMGRGVALQATERFPSIAKELGWKIEHFGNRVHNFPHYHLATLPVKHHWQDLADPALISKSLWQLYDLVGEMDIKKLYLPRPGCGSGRLKWEVVKPMLEVLDDRFIIVNNEEAQS